MNVQLVDISSLADYSFQKQNTYIYIYIYICILLLEICSSMGVELSCEGIAGRR